MGRLQACSRRLVLGALAAGLALSLTTGGRAAHNLTSWVSQGGNDDFDVDSVSIATDGSRVLFATDEGLDAADVDGMEDVYQRAGGVTTLLSPGNEPLDAVRRGESADLRHVVFETNEALLEADEDNQTDLYEVFDGALTLVSTGPDDDGSQPIYSYTGISPDGSRIYFTTAQQLRADQDTDSNKADLYMRSGGTVTLLSRQLAAGTAQNVSDAVMASGGTAVFFTTTERVVDADTDGAVDIYRSTGGDPELVSAPGSTPDLATLAGSTPDGTHAYLTSTQAIDAGDTDGLIDIYESFAGTITLLTPSTITPWADRDMVFHAASADGSRVVFNTKQDLVSGDNDDNGVDAGRDLYVRSGGVTTILTDSTPTGEDGDGLLADANFHHLSADGSRVVFSAGEQLVDDDTDAVFDLYTNTNGVIEWVSPGEDGAGNGASTAFFSGANADGTRIFFGTSEALVSADGDGGKLDLYLRSGGTTELISAGPNPVETAYDVASLSVPAMTPDGVQVLFMTQESLDPDDDDNDHVDLYARAISSVAFDAASSFAAESTMPSVTVSLNASQYAPVQVNYAVTGGTATTADYALTPGTLMFGEGETTKTLPLVVTNDALDENNETIVVTLSSPTGATLGSPIVHTFTIHDNDTATVGFKAAASSVSENNVVLQVAVDLSIPSGTATSVHYAVGGGNATNGKDYTLAAGTLAFPAGVTTRSIAVSIKEDTSVESSETIVLELSAPVGLALGPVATHTVTILNDDAGMCRGKKATIAGTNAAETLVGTPGKDVIVGKGGNDTIRGLGGNDVICGGAGKDGIDGGGGTDAVDGDGGNDTLAGRAGDDALDGGGGNDGLDGGPGAGDTCNGGSGTDSLLPAAGCETATGVP